MPIHPDSHIPVYLQIVAHLRSAIAAGVYRKGEALPSLRALAIELRVNPNTVQRAYDELSRQGVTESRRGMGMFVAIGGADSALARAEASAMAAFQEAVVAAVAAGLKRERVEHLFGCALNAVGARAEAGR